MSRNLIWAVRDLGEPHAWIYWGIIALPCCVSFCCTAKWVSYMHTYVPSLLNLPPGPQCPSLGPHRALSSAPCATQQLPTSHLFHTWWCMYILISQVFPFLHPVSTYPFSVSICALEIGSSVPFFWEKAMAPHSSTLAWKIWWMEEPGRLQSMGLRRVRHDWVTSLWLFTFMYWRRKWQPIPVFLPGESQGWGSLLGCRLWDRTELDTTEAT